MGSGAEVTKQASDIVLTNDNFATILFAIESGRRIFDNVIKFSQHLLSVIVADIIVLVLGLAIRDANGDSIFPMSGVQVLYLNLITASPPAVSLGLERSTPDLMKRGPRNPNSSLFSPQMLQDVFFYGFTMGAIAISNFVISAMVRLPGGFASSRGCSKKGESTTAGCDEIYSARSVLPDY